MAALLVVESHWLKMKCEDFEFQFELRKEKVNGVMQVLFAGTAIKNFS